MPGNDACRAHLILVLLDVPCPTSTGKQSNGFDSILSILIFFVSLLVFLFSFLSYLVVVSIVCSALLLYTRMYYTDTYTLSFYPAPVHFIFIRPRFIYLFSS
jgi:predicted membrane protein